MKVKLIKAYFNVRPYLSEILVPDRRFTSGFRSTGKLEAKSRIEVGLTLECIPEVRLGDTIITLSLGKFRIIAVNGINNSMECKSVSLDNVADNYFSVEQELEIQIGPRVIGESSRP